MENRDSPADRLEKWQRRYAQLKEELRGLGFVCVGTLTTRYLQCGKPACRCHQDPSQRHGPYAYWTRKLQGRTVTVLLESQEVTLFREWIRNSRALDRLVREMRKVSTQALRAQTGKRRA
jgi:hypothetical protein